MDRLNINFLTLRLWVANEVKMRIKFLIVFLTAFIACFTVGCNKQSTPNEGENQPLEIAYSIKHKFQSLEGDFVENKNLFEHKTGVEGDKITAQPLTVNGFTFDEKNELNKTEINLSRDGDNQLTLYYTRNVYTLTVIGGTAKKNELAFGEQVEITPTLLGQAPVLEATGEGAVISSDGLFTMGYGDACVTVGYQGPILLNDEDFVNYKNSAFSVDVNVTDVEQKHGVVFLYSNLLGKESYYSFVSQGTVLRLYLHVGNEEKLLKAKLNVVFEEGAHTYGVKISADGAITCYFDGEEAFTRDIGGLLNAINTPGLYGAFADGDSVSVNSFNIESGKVEYSKAMLGEIKETIREAICFTEIPTYKFDLSTWTIISSVERVDASQSPYFTLAHNLLAEIDACEDTKALIALLKQVDGEYAIELLREAASASMHTLAQDLVDCLLRPYVGNAGEVTNTQSSNSVLSMDIYHKDNRWYVPGAYKLYSGTDGDDKGIFDFLRSELALANTVEEISAICEKFHFDIARNTISLISEFYYVWNYENGYPSYNVWWFIYTYCNDKFEFDYVGCVDGYVFPNVNGFRLSGIYYNGGLAECVKDTTELLVMNKWMREVQIVAPSEYTVTFNLNGGTLEGGTEVTVNAESAYTLPIPQKEGATFDGWYTSRNFRNGSVSVIAERNKADVTLYAKWKDFQPSITVADIFTENMVLPRNKPVSVFGEGVVGKQVTVTFGSQIKTATVKDGAWSVTLDAMSPSTVGQTLTVSSDGVVYTFKNVVVGEVWLCSGQSNMEFRIGWLNLKQLGGYGEMDYSNVRIYRQSVPGASDTYDVNSDRWHAFNSSTKAFDVLNFSAIALGFATELQRSLGENIPVGVVESSRGGTLIEEWMSEELISATGSSVPKHNAHIEARFYDGMTELLRNFCFSGVVWYQGCSNASYPDLYVEQFKALVGEWREMFNNPNLPVIVAQLVQYGDMDFRDFRLMQWQLMDEVSNVYTVSGIDLGLEKDIHPHDKLPLAKRMAAVAARYTYNVDCGAVLSAYPVSVENNGDKVVISFDNAEDGFVCDYVIRGFEVAGADGNYVECYAEVVDGKIVLSGFDFDVVSIRYLYINYVGELDLFTANGLPVAPFVWIL